jgi:hypothetical protein
VYVVVRLSCERPHAVGVKKNTAESITLRQRKQKGQHQAFFSSVLSLNILDSLDFSNASLPTLPHSGQSSQLFPSITGRNAHSLATVV